MARASAILALAADPVEPGCAGSSDASIAAPCSGADSPANERHLAGLGRRAELRAIADEQRLLRQAADYRAVVGGQLSPLEFLARHPQSHYIDSVRRMAAPPALGAVDP